MKQLRLLGLTLLLSISIEVGLRAVEDVLRFNHLLEPSSESEGGLALFVSILLFTTLLEMALSSVRLIATGQAMRALPGGMPHRRRLELIMIESIRGLAAIIARIPLLIIPALVEWVRLLAIPFVVLFDRTYADGQMDALKASRRLTRDHYRLTLVSCFTIAVPPLCEWIFESITALSTADLLPLWIAPSQHIGSCVFFGTLKFAIDAFLIWIYRRAFAEIAT